jgi:DHA1 family quinolone resistance protein-like MFS transporter
MTKQNPRTRVPFYKMLGKMKLNRVIIALIISDILVWTGWGLISPVIAIFFEENIVGGSVAVAGLASTIYFLTKSILQLPIAHFIDKHSGEYDDFWVMIIGSILACVCAVLYVFVDKVWELYLVQVLYGFSGALSYPSYQAIFTRHIDKHEEGFEWSLYYTAVDLGTAIAAGLGAWMIEKSGYIPVFLAVAVTNVVGVVVLFTIKKSLYKRT